MARIRPIYHVNQCYLRHGRKFLFVLVMCSIIIYHLYLYAFPDCCQLCPYTAILTSKQLTFDRFHSVEHYSDFVCPQNFRNLADWVYGWPTGTFDEKIEATTRGYRIAPCLLSGSIIFVKTDYLKKFFRDVYPYLINNFVLITGQGDASSPGSFLSYLHRTDSKIIHWFGQNADIQSTETNKFSPIPIGINCFEMANGIRHVYQQSANRTPPSDVSATDKLHQHAHLLNQTDQVLHQPSDHQLLLLLNFQRLTDPTGLRPRIWEVFCPPLPSTIPFARCIDKGDGVDIPTLPTIYARNRQYPFWLSPRGNGLDCHRTWEALYFDAIPIVWNSTLNSLFVDLPVIIINDWRELTEQFLRTQLSEIATKKMNNASVYRLEKLRFSYWQQLILSKSRHSITDRQRNNQCWRAKTVTKTDRSWMFLFGCRVF